jgi:4'-phosphopantetheinyl transferase
MTINRGSVHIWLFSLAPTGEELARLEGLLSAEEKGQCGRLVRPVDRARCAASRGSVRAVLSRYLDEDPRGLSFRRGTNGKPGLAGVNPPIEFNVSNTGDLGLVAVSRGLRVGIDVERVRDVPDMEGILEDFFGPEETASMRRHGKERTTAFFLLWTRREAAAKALGIGLFDCFARAVLPAPGFDTAGFRVRLPDPDVPAAGVTDWWIRDLAPAPGYAGAVCTERENAAPSFWRLLQE